MSKPQRTYRTRTVRRRPIRTLALTVAAALLVAGCSKELPQTPAAENPKGLESQQASAGSGNSVPEPSPEPTYSVPEYSTDLDLTPEEIREVEEALVALQRTQWTLNQIARDPERLQGTEKEVTDGKYLDEMEEETQRLIKDNQHYNARYTLDSFYITDLRLDDEDRTVVLLTACTRMNGSRLLDANNEPVHDTKLFDRLTSFDITNISNEWKVTYNYFDETPCEK